jgi:hypothetical protein
MCFVLADVQHGKLNPRFLKIFFYKHLQHDDIRLTATVCRMQNWRLDLELQLSIEMVLARGKKWDWQFLENFVNIILRLLAYCGNVCCSLKTGAGQLKASKTGLAVKEESKNGRSKFQSKGIHG